ncbi:uncharacterized protein LOC121888570 [Thunnus maccoyii]|uniref:uncharacterized protein LOC121888570 n=1 Tax=Thunnus maccoyii TaxID=8240 RepID=UPI001C4D3C59|nr:uncharacterized protein LOC121888570 [Thunnus maccoyii]
MYPVIPGWQMGTDLDLVPPLQHTGGVPSSHPQISSVEEASSDHDSWPTQLEQQWLQIEAANKSLQDKVNDLKKMKVNISLLQQRLTRHTDWPSMDPARPRVMIARIHSIRLKELITRLARHQYPLSYKGKWIHIFPHLPAELMKQHQLFRDVRKNLKEAGLQTRILYPARLQVTQGTGIKAASSVERAPAPHAQLWYCYWRSRGLKCISHNHPDDNFTLAASVLSSLPEDTLYDNRVRGRLGETAGPHV